MNDMNDEGMVTGKGCGCVTGKSDEQMFSLCDSNQQENNTGRKKVTSAAMSWHDDSHVAPASHVSWRRRRSGWWRRCLERRHAIRTSKGMFSDAETKGLEQVVDFGVVCGRVSLHATVAGSHLLVE